MSMPLRRPAMVAMLAAAWLVAGLAQRARADNQAPDVVVFCDPPMRAALIDVGRLFRARTGAPVRVLSAPFGAAVAQLAHGERDDVLVDLVPSLDAAARAGLIRPETRVDGWRDRLVIATLGAPDAGQPPAPISSATLPGLLGDGRLALTDPTEASAIDGGMVIGRLGLAGALAGRLQGTSDTGNVDFLIETGAARLGLLFRTDLHADPRLRVAATVPDDVYQPVIYGAALNRSVQSRNAPRFLEFLRSPEAAARLQTDGLEILP